LAFGIYLHLINRQKWLSLYHTLLELSLYCSVLHLPTQKPHTVKKRNKPDDRNWAKTTESWFSNFWTLYTTNFICWNDCLPKTIFPSTNKHGVLF
jgi:hypothetical protein